MLGLNVDMKSSDEDGDVSISELAKHFGVATHVLRHWESVELLVPHRSSVGHRVYGRADRFRVAAILQAKRAGMGLEDIREILTAATPAKRNAVLHRQRDQLIARIADAQSALALVDSGLNCEHGDVAMCPRFESVLAERVDNRSAAGDVAGD